jgi:nicotinamidase-related amidase
VIYPWELHILRPVDVPREVSAMLDIDGITCAMQDERGHPEGRQHMSNIDAMVHTRDRKGRPWARTCSFHPPNKFPELFVACQAW